MIFALVKKDGVYIAKAAFAGNLDIVDAQLASRYPGATFEKFEDENNPTYQAAQVVDTQEEPK